MVIDLRDINNLVYFNGTLPNYDAYRLRLVSRYSNKGMRNTEGVIDVVLYTQTTEWFSMKYVSIPSNFNNEINDYYDCYLEGQCPDSSYQEIQKVLCKVINNFSADNPDVNYISNNEDNEQYIYFIDE